MPAERSSTNLAWHTTRSRVGSDKVDPELRALLTEEIAVGSDQQAFPLLTVDDAGFPYVSLISRAELCVRNMTRC